jgi:hypothetical protein
MIIEQASHFGVLAAFSAVTQVALQRILFRIRGVALINQPEGSLVCQFTH